MALRWLLAACLIVFATLQLKHLSHPLLWQDEGETVMFGQRVLEHGYPKVDDGRNVVFGMGVPLALAVDEERDAYLGSLWGQYYVAALGVALGAGSDDPYRRTLLVRLPFVLSGLAGLALAFLAVVPVIRGAGPEGEARVRAAAVAWLLLLCLSVSLQLHLREARYYALVVLAVGAAVFVHQRAFLPEEPGLAARHPLRTPALAALLLMLFNVFHPAATTLAVWLLLEGGLALRAARGGGLARALPLWLAVLAAALLCLPLFLYFEIASLAAAMSGRWSLGPGVWATNVLLACRYLLRFEMLLPLLALEVALAFTRRQAAPGAEDVARLRRSATSLLRLVAIWVLVGAGNPIFFERYLVPLSPLLSLVVVLDGLVLQRRLGSPALLPRRRGGIVLALALVLAASVAMRGPELWGRVVELAVPYRGPLDFVVEDLRERHADPSRLVIATNYEAEPLMFHLGSRVVGRFHAGTPEADAAEAAVVPDVVIPRTAWPAQLPEIRRYLARGGYARRELPVADLPYNNIPELFAGRVLSVTHRFRTPVPGPGQPALALYERRRPVD